MSRRFTQKVQMPCTAAQYRIIHPDLRKLGYDCLDPGGPDGMKAVLISNGVVYWHHKASKKYDHTPIDTFSPILFLALAACSDSEFGGFGEYWTFIDTTDCFSNGEIYQQINKDIRDPFAFLDDSNSKNGYSGKGETPIVLTKFRKATIAEIFMHLNYADKCYNEKGVEIGMRGPKGVPGLKGTAAVKKLNKACEKRASMPPAPEGRTIREGGCCPSGEKGEEGLPGTNYPSIAPHSTDKNRALVILPENWVLDYKDETGRLIFLKTTDAEELKEGEHEFIETKLGKMTKSFFDQISPEADSATQLKTNEEDIEPHNMDIARMINQLKEIENMFKSSIKKLSPEPEQYPIPLPDYDEPQPTDIPTRNEWEKSRIAMLWDAISSYIKDDKTIPDPWVNELEDLIRRRAEDLPF